MKKKNKIEKKIPINKRKKKNITYNNGKPRKRSINATTITTQERMNTTHNGTYIAIH